MEKTIVIVMVSCILVFLLYGIVMSEIKAWKIDREEKEIQRDPVRIDATIIETVPGTPSHHGFLSIHLHYRFVTPDGVEIEKKDVLTAIKTMDLQNYQAGNCIAVFYLRTDPSKNMLEMKNAIIEWGDKRGKELLGKIKFWK